MPFTLSDADTKDNERVRRLHVSSTLLPTGRCDFLAVDCHKINLSHLSPEHQASAHVEATDGAVALHNGLWRFDILFLQASFKRRQIEAAVLGAGRAKGTRTFSLTLNQRIKQRNRQ
jgi:hypothetical protein